MTKFGIIGAGGIARTMAETIRGRQKRLGDKEDNRSGYESNQITAGNDLKLDA